MSVAWNLVYSYFLLSLDWQTIFCCECLFTVSSSIFPADIFCLHSLLDHLLTCHALMFPVWILWRVCLRDLSQTKVCIVPLPAVLSCGPELFSGKWGFPPHPDYRFLFYIFFFSIPNLPMFVHLFLRQYFTKLRLALSLLCRQETQDRGILSFRIIVIHCHWVSVVQGMEPRACLGKHPTVWAIAQLFWILFWNAALCRCHQGTSCAPFEMLAFAFCPSLGHSSLVGGRYGLSFPFTLRAPCLPVTSD